ncbi:ribonuclease J [Euryhalocaulis caribicus]|uniref:ribonuclease J n=1 Tax=Euryhalocaulis caribicus TaxID=1161401 RepID=UPI0003AAB765|nr:ribonuclease J [Euryhalocaulis caribicus]
MADTAVQPFVFLPLGGCGEIGMNLNLYGYGPEENRKWVIVDLGVTFGDASTPGIDIIMPDAGFIEERADDLLGIVLTHAHEDHMGAVARLWPRLRCPIYATPFTAWLVRDRLQEFGLLNEVQVIEIGLDHRFELGPFDLQLITLTHSIPEPNGLAIRTPAGMVLHTGDWKIDPDPLIGESTDVEALNALGEEGVLALVCDSTNVFVEGHTGSEGEVREELIRVVGEQKGKVAIASFASNVARMETAMVAAEENGRRVCLVGRSMHRMSAAAKSVGLLNQFKPFVDENEAGFFPNDKILFLCTGSQGERRAALSRIASGDHRNVSLGEGDTVIFSSRVIPGNEKDIIELKNKFVERGVELITDRDGEIHVSGHPARDELRQMYQWARPKLAIPVHGERRHLVEHAKLARDVQVGQAIAPHNGDLILLGPGKPGVIDEVPAGRLYVDGDVIVDAEAPSLKDRRKMSFVGHVTVAVSIDARGRILEGPACLTRGIPDAPDFSLDAFEEEMEDVAHETLSRAKRVDAETAETLVMRAVRRRAQDIWGKRPLVDVIVLDENA